MAVGRQIQHLGTKSALLVGFGGFRTVEGPQWVRRGGLEMVDPSVRRWCLVLGARKWYNMRR